MVREKLKTCYVMATFFGKRRVKDHIYRTWRDTYLKMHIARLDTLRLDFDLIQIVCNEERKDVVEDFTRDIPEQIQCIPVVIDTRENKGWSYFAFFHAIWKYRDQFDVYILNEDDHLLCIDHPARYLCSKLDPAVAVGNLVSTHRHLFGVHFSGFPIAIRSDIAIKVADAARRETEFNKVFNYRLGSHLQFFLVNYIVSELKEKITHTMEDYSFEMWNPPYYLDHYYWNEPSDPLLIESAQKYTMNLSHGSKRPKDCLSCLG